MKILFVTYDFPFPITSGGKNRAYNLIKHTSKKAEIYLFSFVRTDFEPDYIEQIKDIGVINVAVFERKKLMKFSNLATTIKNNSSIFKTLYLERQVEEKLIDFIRENKIDIVHFESSYTGFFICSNISKLRVKTVLGMENIEFMLYEDYAKKKNILFRPLIRFQANKFKKEEIEMIKSADITTTITEKEKQIVEEMTGKEAAIVSNGIDPLLLSYDFNSGLKNNILFVGNFAYFPNVDAINFFCDNTFDKLDKKITLTIVGKKVKSKFQFEDDRIISKEFVEDIIPEYRSADALIFPVRIGGGTNFKVLEAMSLGVPIVAFPERLEGLNAKPDEHFLQARNPEEFISQINRLYNDKGLRERISKNARKLVVANFSWEKIGDDLLKVWRKLI